MKYLLLFLISFNAYSMCLTSTEAEINGCTMELLGVETQEELDQWKISQLDALAERNRVQAQKDRLIALGGRFGKHKSFSGLSEHFAKCNVTVSNKALYVYKTLLKKGNESLIDCLESEDVNVKSEKQAREQKANDNKAVENRMKNADCGSLSGQLLQDMCTMLKR